MTTVYVIENPKGALYVGLTEDVAHRLESHNNGGCVTTSKIGGPWTLKHQWDGLDYISASKLERLLHRQKAERLREFIVKYPTADHFVISVLATMKTTPYELRRNSELGYAH
jgi:Predicted endonuclease containing a URI domain